MRPLRHKADACRRGNQARQVTVVLPVPVALSAEADQQAFEGGNV
jgi:hypothetical protein